MADVRLLQIVSLEAVTIDWAMTPAGQLDDTMQLQTAALIALGTDRRAGADDTLPDRMDDDRRGWWGDLNATDIWNGWPIGSRLWLLARAKITDAAAREGATVERVRIYVREAMQPFLDYGLATRMDVTAERAGLSTIRANVTLYRGPRDAIRLSFQDLWAGIAA